MDKRWANDGWAAEVDMGHLLSALMHRVWIIIVSAILCAVIAFVGTKYLVMPQYQSSVMLYVNNRSISSGNIPAVFTSDSISNARRLADTYIVLLNSRTTLEEVIAYAGISDGVDEIQSDLTVEISEFIEVERVNETEVFRVIVQRPDPNEAEQIANAIASVLPRRISEIMGKASAKLVEAAVVSSQSSIPDLKNSLVLGGLFGVVLGIGIIFRRELWKVNIKSTAELARYHDILILGVIPDLVQEKSDSSKKRR